MGSKLIVRQSYRLFVALVGAWSLWSILWATASVGMPAATIGYGWVAIAVVGALITVGLYRTRSEVFTGSKRERKRFRNHSLGGGVLHLYALLLVGWTAVFFGWFTGGIDLAATTVGYGWFAIAAYGGVLTLGLLSKHSTVVTDTLTSATSDTERA